MDIDNLNRPGDEVGPINTIGGLPEQSIPTGRKPRKSLSETGPMPTTGEPDLRAENAELKARLDRMEQVLLALGANVRPAADAPVKTDELDKNRRYSKTRTMGGGVTFEQDGRKFNARGQLMVEA